MGWQRRLLGSVSGVAVLLAVGNEFRGVFAANNIPDRTNFPYDVTYQRRHNFTTRMLLDAGGNPVSVSIDPFYFSVPVLR